MFNIIEEDIVFVLERSRIIRIRSRRQPVPLRLRHFKSAKFFMPEKMLLHTSRVKPTNSSRSLQSSPSGPKRTMNLLLSSRICLVSLVQEFWRYFRRSLITSTDEGYLKPSNRPWPALNAASVLAFRSAWSVNARTMSDDRRGGSSRMKTVAEQVGEVHSKA
jgi:hypothetical protein